MKPLMEAVMKQARSTRHPWLVACDANKTTGTAHGTKAGTCSLRRQEKEFPLTDPKAQMAS